VAAFKEVSAQEFVEDIYDDKNCRIEKPLYLADEKQGLQNGLPYI
jgi:hypothetical protein